MVTLLQEIQLTNIQTILSSIHTNSNYISHKHHNTAKTRQTRYNTSGFVKKSQHRPQNKDIIRSTRHPTKFNYNR